MRCGKVTAPSGSIAWKRPCNASPAVSRPPPGSRIRAERLGSGSWMSSPPISRTPLGSLVVVLKKSPLMPATAPASSRDAIGPGERAELGGRSPGQDGGERDPRGGGGAHDVHDPSVVAGHPLVAHAGGHLGDPRRALGGQGAHGRSGRDARGRHGGGGQDRDRYRSAHRGEPNHARGHRRNAPVAAGWFCETRIVPIALFVLMLIAVAAAVGLALALRRATRAAREASKAAAAAGQVAEDAERRRRETFQDLPFTALRLDSAGRIVEANLRALENFPFLVAGMTLLEAFSEHRFAARVETALDDMVRADVRGPPVRRRAPHLPRGGRALRGERGARGPRLPHRRQRGGRLPGAALAVRRQRLPRAADPSHRPARPARGARRPHHGSRRPTATSSGAPPARPSASRR